MNDRNRDRNHRPPDDDAVELRDSGDSLEAALGEEEVTVQELLAELTRNRTGSGMAGVSTSTTGGVVSGTVGTGSGPGSATEVVGGSTVVGVGWRRNRTAAPPRARQRRNTPASTHGLRRVGTSSPTTMKSDTGSAGPAATDVSGSGGGVRGLNIRRGLVKTALPPAVSAAWRRRMDQI